MATSMVNIYNTVKDISFTLYDREHDKGPEELCSVVQKLLDNDMEFCLSILGAHTNDIPSTLDHLLYR